ncbi:MAG: hypothetical protein AAB378_00970 [Patescibacteria group bacterium]
MEIWQLEKKKEGNVWDKKPFGNFPDRNESLFEMVLNHMNTRKNSKYSSTYWIVFTKKEEEALMEFSRPFLSDKGLGHGLGSDFLDGALLYYIQRFRTDAPTSFYISEDPNEFTTPPFRLALMFRVK